MITYNRKFDISRSNLCTVFINVFDPTVVVFKVVGRDPDDLHVALGEVGSSPSDLSKFGCADRGEVPGM